MALECVCARVLTQCVKPHCLGASRSGVFYMQPTQHLNFQLKDTTPTLYWPFKVNSLFRSQNLLRPFLFFYPHTYLGKMGLKYQSNHNRNFVKDVRRQEAIRMVRSQDVIGGVRRVIHDKKANFRQTGERWRRKSKRILADIRETKSKMREKMEEVIERENIYTVPNLLCVSRIVMSPFLGYLIVEQDFSWAMGVLAVAGVTDLLDGWIARTFKNQSSKLGSFLDPLSDKVLVATMFLTLTYVDIIPVALTGLIITRDALLVTAGFVIRYKSLPPPRTLSRYFDATHATAQLAPTFISKVNTTVQLLTVACTLAAPVFHYVDHPALQALWWVTAGTTCVSAGSYLLSKNTFKFLKKSFKP